MKKVMISYHFEVLIISSKDSIEMIETYVTASVGVYFRRLTDKAHVEVELSQIDYIGFCFLFMKSRRIYYEKS